MRRPVHVNPGRIAAARTLLDVDRGVHVEDALGRYAPNDAGDRSLAWHLALGVLRNRLGLDGVITTAARRAPRTLDAEVLAVLRLGIFETQFGRVPPHAAVDQAVELARRLGVGHASGFVNAVMRKQLDLKVDPALAHGHPDWLAARWRARYGEVDANAWMLANNAPAPLYLVAREDPAGLCRLLQHAGIVAVPVGDGVFQVPSAPVDTLPGFEEGLFWVMDPAAVAVADLVPDVAEVIDVCAAPGGKSFRLASRGIRVVATDRSEDRLGRLRENAARLRMPVEAVTHDWERSAMDCEASAILLDAPCTGLGTLRRHPDIRWRREEADIRAAAEKQARILLNAAMCVAPGGCLVYAVCSPEPEEGPEVAATLGWPIEARFENAPCTDGADAFFAVRMRRPA